MTFTSFKFLLFFPSVVVLYNIVPRKWRIIYLLLVSYVFYGMLQPVYLLLLSLVTLTTYFFTCLINRTQEEKQKHRYLIYGIILILFPLFFFKYFNFVDSLLSEFLCSVGLQVTLPTIKFLLPVGISFYTFMAIGYMVDVYNEDVKIERNIGAVGLFLSFFPIILSGPIERAGNIFPQLKKLTRSRPDDLMNGAKLILWGYFMKLCVADRLGIYIDAVYNNITHHNGTSLAFASILYPFQVYADLGGYSLIAIGVASCLGLKVIPNFNRPFFATSMSEFWRRWHMSLIQWLTDYVYTPLSFVLLRWRIWGIVVALMLTFLISGIWHGATLTFVIWGLVQGFYLSIEALLRKRRTNFELKHRLNKRWWYILICCVVVFVLFAFSQIFGRSATVSDAFVVVEKISMEHGSLFIHPTTLFFGLLSLAILFIKDFFDEYSISIRFLSSKYIAIRCLSICSLVAYILLFGVLSGGQFIYFQF